MQIAFTNKIRVDNDFHFKDLIPEDLTFGVAYKFPCGVCIESYYIESVTHFNVRTGDDIGIWKQLKTKNSSLADSNVWEQNCFTMAERESLNDEEWVYVFYLFDSF